MELQQQQLLLVLHVKPLRDDHYILSFSLADCLLHSSSEAKSLLLLPSTESSQSGTGDGSGRPGQALERGRAHNAPAQLQGQEGSKYERDDDNFLLMCSTSALWDPISQHRKEGCSVLTGVGVFAILTDDTMF